jgi:UDPglucose--hexose-1-phosphate uridylyltransferase
VLAVFPEIHSIGDFKEEDLQALVEGILKIFRYFMTKSIGSFNASFFFGPSGQDYFSPHFRIVPRTFLNLRDFASDLNFFQALLAEPVSVVMPERMCSDIKGLFV